MGADDNLPWPDDDLPATTVERWRLAARRALPAEVVDYIAGGSGTELTARRSSAAWDDIQLVPRILRDVSAPSLTTDLLGLRLDTPIGVAPTGYHQLVHPSGEVATAGGASAAGALYTASTRSSLPLEDVAAAAGPWWFQVYVLRDRARTEALVQRAASLGASALVLTADMPYLAVRQRDVRNGFVLPATVSSAARSGAEWATGGSHAQDPAVTFVDIEWLAALTGLPVVVKGVLHPGDAATCIEAGAAGVWVSAHGGRQLDGAIAPALALPAVVDAVAGRAPVLVDGGIRSGTDVLRALALGADAAFIGRPVLWAAAHSGAAGVEQLLSTLADELRLAMALCGACTPLQIDRSIIHGTAP